MLDFLILIGFLLLSTFGFSQETENTQSTPPVLSKIEQHEEHPLVGTFQLILLDERMLEPVLTEEIFDLVQQNRMQSQETVIELDAYTKLKIASHDFIDSEGFIPLKTYVYAH